MKIDHCGTATSRWVPDSILGFDLTAPCMIHDVNTDLAETLTQKARSDRDFRDRILSRRHIWEIALLEQGRVVAYRLLRGLLTPLRYSIAWSYYLAVASPVGKRHWRKLQAAKKGNTK